MFPNQLASWFHKRFVVPKAKIVVFCEKLRFEVVVCSQSFPQELAGVVIVEIYNLIDFSRLQSIPISRIKLFHLALILRFLQ